MRAHEHRSCKALLALIFTLLSACSEAEPEAPRCSPDLASIQQNIFVKSCAQAGCHGENEPAALLRLTGENVAAELVGVPSSTCSNRIRVVPGSPDQSLLYEKITSATPACGTIMPPSGALPAEDVACVRQWIASMPVDDAGPGDAGCTSCGGSQCVDLMNDPAHCGACDVTCPPGASCAAGACSCSGGLTVCGASCSDTASDPANCGKCGNACAGGEVCNMGACSATCGALAVCDGACVDLATNPSHCGECGKACALGQTCAGGACSCGGASVSFSATVLPILTSSCATNGCHKGANPQQNLDLTAAGAYQDLVNVPAQQCNDGRKRVLPGDASQSYLIDKMLGINMCAGTQMPKQNKLPSEQIDTVVSWICAGAPNN
jgi:hypothetical protein